MGFHSSKSDSSHFTRFNNIGTLLIIIYVDDILITISSSFLVQIFIKYLSDKFALKDLSLLPYFLGIEVNWLGDDNLYLSQTKYIKDLLQRAKMINSNPQPIPMFLSSILTIDGSIVVEDPTIYRFIVGALQYVTVTWPELSLC